ncbi:MAG: PAS domain S-box protein [Desulfonatronovibrio sp.]
MPRPSSKKKEPGQYPFSDLHDILTNAPIGIFTSTPEGRFLSANPELAEIFGYDSPEELIESVTDIAAELFADPKDSPAIIRLLATEGLVKNYECEQVRKDGSRFWASGNIRAVYAEDGSVSHYQGFVTDITARKISENQWQDTFDLVPDLIALIDTSHRILRVNRSMADRLNCSPEEICGRHCYEIVHGTSAPPEFCPHSKSICNASTESVEVFEERLKGFFCVTTTPIYNSDGRLAGSLHVARDITEKKQVEKTIQASESRFHNLLRDIPSVAVQGYDMNGKTTYWNRASEKLYGYTREEALGRHLVDLIIPKEMKDKVLDEIRTMSESKAPVTPAELCLERKDGTRVPVYSSHVLVNKPDGQCELFCLDIDLTRLKKTEQSLRLQSLVLDQIEDRVTITDLSGRITYVNKAEVKALGLPREEILNKSTDIYGEDPEQGATQQEIIKKTKQNGSWKGEVVNYSKDGREMILDCRTQVVHDEEDLPVALCCISTDITGHKRAQEALVLAKEEAESANRAKSEFLANMSHEIRTPLNGIMGMMQLLSKTGLNQDQEELVNLGSVSAKRLTQLLSDILELSSIDAGKMIIREKEFNLHDICSSIKDLFIIPAREKGIDFHCSLAPPFPENLIGDDTRVQQILVNLVGNAVKFTDNGSVSLSISPVSQPDKDSMRVFFSIADTGTGIPEDKLDDLFQPFSQADGSLSRQYQGAGLGLVIVFRLVEMMNGNIAVESEPGRGTTVHVVLPFTLPAKQHSKLVTKPSIFQEPKKHLNILLAEDDSLNQLFIKRILEKEGHNVNLAKNGKEAVDMLQEQNFDCILMDIQMPVMTGIEATKTIRESTSLGAKKDVPIIAVTAHAQPGDREIFLDAGMDDYLGKPVRLEDFQRVFNKFFGDREIQT